MKKIIEQGLVGLANAGTLNGGNWFVGHFGAEVLSLAFLLLNKRIDKNAEPMVLDRIEEIIKSKAEFFETPLPKPSAENSLQLKDFELAVENCISKFCVDGHHAIYSALALRGFSQYPDLIRPEIIQGLIGLLDACEAAGFDRFYGLSHDAFEDESLLEKFACKDALEAAKIALGQHSEVITDREADGAFYFFSGSRLHLVTHAQALLELDQIGYANIVKSGLPGFIKHCICIEASRVPEGGGPYQVMRPLNPEQVEFWKRGKTNPHHGKLAYSTLEIFSALPHSNEAKTLKELSSYWEFYE